MLKMSNEDRIDILEVLASLQSIAENEQSGLEDFLIMKQYSLLRDPNRFLILGGRGSGKTKVFRTFSTRDGFEKIIGTQPQLQAPRVDNCDVVAGYDLSSKFPTQDILDPYAEDKKARAYWVGSLLIVLLDTALGKVFLRDSLCKRFGIENAEHFFQKDCLKRPSEWIEFIQNNAELWGSVLDDFNEYLESQDRWIFVSYDYLDRVTNRYALLFPFIRSLISFWFTRLKRWRRLKCKIFLRNDLFQSKLLNFMDASKLSNSIIRLEWSPSDLYRLLVKRIANSNSQTALGYLQLCNGLILDGRDTLLGYEPTQSPEILKKFVEQMIGPYMGSTPKKGQSYSWVPNHLQDAKGTLAPRSFIKCFAVAAQKMLDRRDEFVKMDEYRLILPYAIQDAIASVSDDRVKELQEEYPWLEQLKTAFKDLTMLMDKDTFIEKIDMDLWDAYAKQSLPESTPQGIFSVLQELGIVLLAEDGRVNVPEIYLHGFRMKRKGGLRRSMDFG